MSWFSNVLNDTGLGGLNKVADAVSNTANNVVTQAKHVVTQPKKTFDQLINHSVAADMTKAIAFALPNSVLAVAGSNKHIGGYGSGAADIARITEVVAGVAEQIALSVVTVGISDIALAGIAAGGTITRAVTKQGEFAKPETPATTQYGKSTVLDKPLFDSSSTVQASSKSFNPLLIIGVAAIGLIIYFFVKKK